MSDAEEMEKKKPLNLISYLGYLINRLVDKDIWKCLVEKTSIERGYEYILAIPFLNLLAEKWVEIDGYIYPNLNYEGINLYEKDIDFWIEKLLKEEDRKERAKKIINEIKKNEFIEKLKNKIRWINISAWDVDKGRLPLLAYTNDLPEKFNGFWKKYKNSDNEAANKYYTVNELVSRSHYIRTWIIMFDKKIENILKHKKTPNQLYIPDIIDHDFKENLENFLTFFGYNVDESEINEFASKFIEARQYWKESCKELNLILFIPVDISGLVDIEGEVKPINILAIGLKVNPDSGSDSFSEEENFLGIFYRLLLYKIQILAFGNLSSKRSAQIKKLALKNAISAIMSRNMSHNIGSHILSFTATESISSAEDRILFKYIQQRMDFIAQISTKMQKWSYSPWFNSEIMKKFYMQSLLLNYLAKSEGISAYEKGNSINNKNKLIIKVKNNTTIIIDPTKNSTAPPSNPKLEDFQIAIPGGVVGIHAFYTILENIIRNSAKHAWSKLPSNERPDNLEITIEYNNSNQSCLAFNIYDNVSYCNDELVNHINEIFKDSLISEDNKLKKENWGLAEIRISAGYLNFKSYSEIGKGGNEILDFISAKKVNKDSKSLLGFSFKVPKPKEILLIDKEWPDHRVDYDLVVVSDNLKELKKHIKKLPCRVIFVPNTDNNISDLEKELGELGKGIAILKREEYEDIKNKCTTNNNMDIEKFYLEIYKKWLNKIKKDNQIQFLLNIEGKSSDGGNKLKESKISNILLKKLKSNHIAIKNIIGTNNKITVKNENNSIRICRENNNNELLKIYIGNNNKLVITGDKKIKAKIENFVNIMKEIISDLIFKYEENIKTLPEILKQDSVNITPENIWKSLELGNDFSFCNNPDEANICYIRHYNFNNNSSNSRNSKIYIEPLSGSQFYFTMLQSLLKEDNFSSRKVILSLLENALLKMIILDERIYKYINSDNRIKNIFNSINIRVLNNFDEFNQAFNNETKNRLNDYHILIIHQGILDKKFEKKEEMENWINEINNQIPWIFVTSGRGKPNRLPSNARFVPFSSLESSLLKDYPEKLLLIQTLMKIPIVEE